MHNIDVVQIVKVLSVKPTKNQHTTPQETGTMSPPCLWNLTLDLSSWNLIFLRIKDQDVVQVIAKTTSENINFVIVNRRSMTPSGQKSIILHFPFFPPQRLNWTSFKERSQVDRVDITETTVFGMASGDYEELIANFSWGVESSSTRTLHFWRDGNLSPSHAEEIEDPEVIQVTDSLSSINHQVWIEQFGSMVSPGPRCRLISFRTDLNPFLSFPVKQADGIESLLVWPSSSKQDQSIVVLIVVHGAIGT